MLPVKAVKAVNLILIDISNKYLGENGVEVIHVKSPGNSQKSIKFPSLLHG